MDTERKTEGGSWGVRGGGGCGLNEEQDGTKKSENLETVGNYKS